MSAAPERSTAALGVHSLFTLVIVYGSAFAASVLIALGSARRETGFTSSR